MAVNTGQAAPEPGSSPAVQLSGAIALLALCSMLGCFVLHWFAQETLSLNPRGAGLYGLKSPPMTPDQKEEAKVLAAPALNAG